MGNYIFWGNKIELNNPKRKCLIERLFDKKYDELKESSFFKEDSLDEPLLDKKEVLYIEQYKDKMSTNVKLEIFKISEYYYVFMKLSD